MTRKKDERDMISHASMKRTPFLAKSTMTIPERRRPKKNQWDLPAGWPLKYRGPYKEQHAARIRRGIKKNALNGSMPATMPAKGNCQLISLTTVSGSIHRKVHNR